MGQPYKCPVCDGVGCRISLYGSTSCTACNSTGIVWSPDCTDPNCPIHNLGARQRYSEGVKVWDAATGNPHV